MRDRKARNPGKHKAYVPADNIEAMQRGEPFDIVLVRNDDPEVAGTPYNKASVLPDSVARVVCPNVEDPTPADALRGLSDAIDFHKSDKGNPHEVTCTQIGAVSQKEFDDVLSNLNVPDDGDPGQLIPHLINRDNPHSVTAAQVGAAPAGYGLGEASSAAINWNAGFQNAFVRSNQNSPDGKWWYGLTCREQPKTGTTTEIAFSVDAGNSVSEARRSRNSGSIWGEWEYVNPPMLEGVEYRTTERFNGKPVYTKLVHTDSLGNGTTKHFTLVEEPVNVINLKAFLARTSDGGYFPLPSHILETGGVSAYIYAAYVLNNEYTTVSIVSTANMEDYTAYITVKYTKNEEESL